MQAVRSDPALSTIPIVMLTSAGDHARQAQEAGAFVCLTKPVRQAHLHATLEQALGKVGPRSAIALLAPYTTDTPVVSDRPLVLVAEDNAINLLLTRKLLDKLGYRVDQVADGRLAVEASARTRYAAILMDCQMPEMDGYEATGAIRRREADGPHVPIIALTAHAMTGDRERVLSAGMDDYVTKPVSLELLKRVLQRWITAEVPAER
jgi:two-component system, sensor histidine kinase and response regulator